MLITFIIVLWQTAGTLTLTLLGKTFNLHGYMVYMVVLIVIVGTMLTHKIGEHIRPLNVEKQCNEATFRTHPVQHNAQAGLIALSHGEDKQYSRLYYPMDQTQTS